MKIKRPFFSYFIYLFLFPALLTANPGTDIRLERLSIEEGISHNLVYCLFQDRQGFMWFGTMYGLVKYDGIRYRVFRHDANDANSISYDDIISLYEDNYGKLWIGTWGGGLNCFDPVQETFARYIHQPADSASISGNIIWSIAETNDRAGHFLWFGTEKGGLSRLRVNDNGEAVGGFESFRHSPENEHSINGNMVKSMLVDSQKRLWIVTNNGINLSHVNENDIQFARYACWQESKGDIPATVVNSLMEEAPNRFLVASNNGILEMMLDENETPVFAKKYQNDPENSASLADNIVNILHRDQFGALWAGTRNGLSFLSPENEIVGKFINFAHQPDDPNSLRSNQVLALCEDQSGIVWVSAYYGGVHKLIRGKNKFAYHPAKHSSNTSTSGTKVQTFFQDSNEMLWVGTTGEGLLRFSLPKRKTSETFYSQSLGEIEIKNYKKDRNNPFSLKINRIAAIVEEAEAAEKTLWLGSYGAGLIRMQPDAPKKSRYAYWLAEQENENSLSHSVVTSVAAAHHPETGAFYLWAGTVGGLNRVEIVNGTPKKFRRYFQAENDSAALPHDWILSLYTTPDGTLWVGSYGGLSRYDWENDCFITYKHNLNDPSSLSNNYVYAMHEDKKGRFWIGTSNGLNLLDRKNSESRYFLQKDGLPNGVICGILEDDAGFLWLSTQKGLSRFDPRTEAFRNFDNEDGLQSNIFAPGAAFQDESGIMYFGGINGLNYFHPFQIHDREAPPIVRLTQIQLFDKPVQLFPEVESVEFSYQENHLTFEFAALDYTSPGKNHYAYKLEGLEEQWTQASSRNVAAYPHLPPGRYTFLVKGSNHDGVWNETPASFHFVIQPPFWQTFWFYLFSILVIAVLVWYVHHYRLQRRLAQAAAIEQARRAERDKMREKTARDYHDQLGHQLTKISLYGELLRRHLQTEISQESALSYAGRNNKTSPFSNDADFLPSARLLSYLDKITGAAGRLCDDARDFIWALNPEKDAFYDTILHLKAFGEALFEETGIHFKVTGLRPEMIKVKLSMDQRRHLTLIFKEAMNNTLKHAHARKVQLNVSQKNTALNVTLQDDGIGIGDVQNRQSGNGLRNMKNRAEKIQGELGVKTAVQGGTLINFTMEINNNSRSTIHH